MAPDTNYRLTVSGARDVAGVEIEPITMALRTVAAPSVVRFRPRAATTDVARDTTFSVRFTKSMDRASTKAAFSITADGKRVPGKIRFAEDDTVLIFDPSSNLTYRASVVTTIAATARSTDDVPLGVPTKATFRVAKKPAPATQATQTRTTTNGSGGGGGGGAVGGGSWAAVERYYLRLMNCTRTGGLVTRAAIAPAPAVAASRRCGSTPGSAARSLARTPGSWPSTTCAPTSAAATRAIGCAARDTAAIAGRRTSAAARATRSARCSAAIASSRASAPWSPDGGHYVNLMNSAYDRVGIGVWVSGGRVRLVVDFYHP